MIAAQAQLAASLEAAQSVAVLRAEKAALEEAAADKVQVLEAEVPMTTHF